MAHTTTKSRHQQIAEAIADAINAASWNEPFTAELIDTPTADLADLADLSVAVLTGAHRREQMNRAGATRHEYEIEVAIRQALEPTTEEERISRLKALAADLADWFDNLRPDGAAFITDITDPGPSLRQLEEFRAYVHVLTITIAELTAAA
jgi:hypothetical protein